MSFKASGNCKKVGFKSTIAALIAMDLVLLGALTIIVPSLSSEGSAQWAPQKAQYDTNGGQYNWSIGMHTPDDYNEPADWTGMIEYLTFSYDYNTMLNASQLLNGTTISMKGDVDWSFKAYDIYMNYNKFWSCSPSYCNPSESTKDNPGFLVTDTQIDPVAFAALGYNVSMLPMYLGLDFNVWFLKSKDISEITIKFNNSIGKADGKPYYAQPLVTSQKVFPKRIFTEEMSTQWGGPGVDWTSQDLKSALHYARMNERWWKETKTSYADGSGWQYAWTDFHFVRSLGKTDTGNSIPKDWDGRMIGLELQYNFSTRMNYTSLLNGVTVTISGDSEMTYKFDPWSANQFTWNGAFDYANNTDHTTIGMIFNMSYLEVHNVKEISLTVDTSVMKWNGTSYTSMPVRTSFKVEPTKLLEPSKVDELFGMGGPGSNWFTNTPGGMFLLFEPLIPLFLIWGLIIYVEMRNKNALKERKAKGLKKIKTAPNGIAETMLKLLDQSEKWMDKRRNYVLITTVLSSMIYFVLSAVVLAMASYAVSGIIQIAVFVFVGIVPWFILIVYTYYYNRLRTEDLLWKIKIRTLKKREGDYLDALK
jgi:hypothetical protein